jgi:hypothetical protein
MNSPNGYSEEELDHLVKGALQARVSGEEPPDRVWERIKLELEPDQPAPPRWPRVALSPLAVQAALTLLLVVVGSIGLHRLLDPNGLRNALYDISPSGTIAYVDERSLSAVVTGFDDEAELRSLKADLRSNPIHRSEAEPNSSLPVEIPRDVPPNILITAGHVLELEPSLSLMVKEQSPIRSGPYPWYR